MKSFAVLGYPLEHSRSPFLHKLLYEAWDLPYAYIPLAVAPDEIDNILPVLRRNFSGFNVTLPYKKTIIPYLDRLDLSAEVYGAVNTVKNENGQLIGYNTDGHGFLTALNKANYALTNKRALLLGAGGAAQTVALELAHQGCQITIANRDIQRAYELQVLVEKRHPQAWLEVAKLERIPKRNYQVVINATPVGMGTLTNQSPLASSYLNGVEFVYDLIYNPAETLLLKEAKSLGCQVGNGLTMLVEQGLQAAEIWLEREVGEELRVEIMAKLAEEVKA